MHSKVPPHEKIRFRRGDIARLDRLPSAMPFAGEPIWRRVPGSVGKAVAGLIIALLLLLVVAVGVVAGGLGNERLRLAAQSALEALSGEGMTTQIGEAGVTFDGVGGLALEVGNTRLTSRTTGVEVAHVGSTRFALRFAPLLRGVFEIGRVSLADVRVDLAAAPRADGPLGPPFFDERGLLNADSAAAVIFAAVDRLATAFDSGGVDRIELADVDIALADDAAGLLRISVGALERDAGGALTLSADLEAGGRIATVRGHAAPDEGALRLELSVPAEGDGEAAALFGAAELSIVGTQASGGSDFAVSGRVSNARLPLGREGFRADIALDATAQRGSGKLEIDRLRVASGRSALNFHGAVGPTPAEPGTEPSYRFELVSDGSTVAPLDSPESPLSVVARIAGRFDAAARLFTVGEIGVRTRQSEVRGDGVLHFAPGSGSPGLRLNIAVNDMPVAEAKQLWPIFSASAARRWVVANVFGGRIETGRIELDVAPGQFGNGVPLNAEEVKGRFSIRGTRFDVAGRMPPVRDAVGTVDFRGTDIDITLDSGTAYSPSGRAVNAANGRLAIRDAHIKPVVGKLDISVDGSADAVLELARYEPIAVGRFIDLTPDDVSGQVSGVVAADIPLQRGIPVDSLGWRVELDYDNLSLAKAFDGQTVSGATGSIVVDPAMAVIDATAQLNDAPAKLRLIEPLGRDKSGRERRVSIEMDNRARNAVAPGLDALLSGPTEVEMNDTPGEPRAVRIGLDRATLSIPWVGWSKGGGVPATAIFDMTGGDGRTELSDFRLEGESFGATGTLSLVDGALQRARFPSARLSRGDDFSVDVQARGGGYAVTVRGDHVDARAALKLHLKESGGGEGSRGGAPVSVDLELGSMSGFNGETLRDVKLAYSGAGSHIDRLEMSATTASGAPVSFTDLRDGAARRIAMSSTDAGAVLRFLDIYDHMQGGSIELSLEGAGDGPLSGRVDARDFWVVNEPRLSSIVSSAPHGEGRSLNDAVRGEIDASRVHFERGFTRIVKAPGSLALDSGILRGPAIGMTFQGSLYDREGNMALTGTFMPAYGLNRIFGEIPLIGQILGNGRDRGLIGITFRLAGKADEPQLQVNPLSAIAPGIFRSVFEFR